MMFFNMITISLSTEHGLAEKIGESANFTAIAITINF
jgi:hypothetical protein